MEGRCNDKGTRSITGAGDRAMTRREARECKKWHKGKYKCVDKDRDKSEN
jgi:hypothetical protein